MPSTPKTRGTPRKKRGTPGDKSTSSRASDPGVNFFITKQFAKELEEALPIADCPDNKNSVAVLLESDPEGQPLANFLDELVVDDPLKLQVFGERGSKPRIQIGHLVQYWKSKDKAWYRSRVLKRCKLQEKEQSSHKKQDEEEQDSASDLSEDSLIGKTVATEKKLPAKQLPAKKQPVKKLPAKKQPKEESTMPEEGSYYRTLSDGTIEGASASLLLRVCVCVCVCVCVAGCDAHCIFLS